jgi:hypothetical protein
MYRVVWSCQERVWVSAHKNSSQRNTKSENSIYSYSRCVCTFFGMFSHTLTGARRDWTQYIYSCYKRTTAVHGSFHDSEDHVFRYWISCKFSYVLDDMFSDHCLLYYSRVTQRMANKQLFLETRFRPSESKWSGQGQSQLKLTGRQGMWRLSGWQCHHVKVKLSCYRPGEALGIPEGWGSRISRQSAHDGGKVVSPTHRPSLPLGRIPGTHFY